MLKVDIDILIIPTLIEATCEQKFNAIHLVDLLVQHRKGAATHGNANLWVMTPCKPLRCRAAVVANLKGDKGLLHPSLPLLVLPGEYGLVHFFNVN